ncbi:MAG: iron transporter [Candidatus Magasanikbacteria bacterium RIFCSPHIGHO2_01_FULL_41_23]|uniref:Iron transporter n=1 Tax=Candidatus Magasanikbacteria bacterium RIFCSPLOWO2_01_FULL_40_15 TaxID=1798686 RepID=A0A1F6N0Q2_9BACT|nr:MAG: iron transporter [Candidatus Magasanikbacteria bacterium RIFCSPHIGHO2_01_FULL_41_23]OGH74635.1 MAG: iron transporter [Candidatus Magasanikbacteria bacterium RIFCSPHIGHO2_12_FULL_41_16]OGH77348.1 MAG: iron transporter [Candidatus Magasanikbacteria bacterium RIFCSPLOWO2_01_FULL_40_15]
MNQKIKHFLKKLGPGFITGASDDDPSGIATYTQTGAQFGLTQLWTALYTFPFMTVVQEMCGRIGLVTGQGLAGVIRNHFSKKLLFFSVSLLLIANTINIGADLGAMAAAAQLLFPRVSFSILILIFTFTILFLEIFVSYKVYLKYLKYFALSLLAYIATAFVVKMDWGTILFATLVPHISFTREYLLNIIALLGTTISPYLFFWQTGEEVEEEVAHNKIKDFGAGKPKIRHCDVRRMRLDTFFGMFFSNLITFFIIATAATTLGVHGIADIQTAADAALALKPLAGNFAYLLFTVGIIGTGLLAVPILAGSASYAVSESFNWKEGLYRKFSDAHGFYMVIMIATVVGLLVNFTKIPPFKMLYYTAVVNGAIAPILMIVILRIANNKKIMGEYVNSRASNILGWVITLIMGGASIGLFWSFLF